LAVLGLLLVLAAFGAGIWAAVRPPVAQFLIPGATNIHATALERGDWQISYRAAGSPAMWSTTLGNQLEQQRWISQGLREYEPLTPSYTRTSPLGPIQAWEWAFLHLDPLQPQIAHIRVRRVIAFPWLRQFGAELPPLLW
jgi:hypothetical protein